MTPNETSAPHCAPNRRSPSTALVEQTGQTGARGTRSTSDRKTLPNDRGASARLTRGPECLALTSGRLESRSLSFSLDRTSAVERTRTPLTVDTTGKSLEEKFRAAPKRPIKRRGRTISSAPAGLVPRQYSTGGKTRLGHITKRGDPYLRTLLVMGARAVLQRALSLTDPFSRWALAVRERRGYHRACIAIAAKNARVAWALLAKEPVTA
jgi:Transposase IS116/IS110/IS902 family